MITTFSVNQSRCMLKKKILLIYSFLVVSVGWALNPDSLWKAVSAQSEEEKVETYILLSDYYLENNQDSVVEVIDALKALKGNKVAAIQAELIAATAAYYKGDNDKSIALCFAGQQKAAQEGFTKLEVSFRHTRALCYYAQSYYENTLELSRENVALSDSLDYAQGQGDALILMANVFIQKGRMDSAMFTALKARKIVQFLGDEASLIVVWQLIGNVNLYQGNYPEALDFYLKAYEKAEKRGDQLRVAKLLNNMGIVYANMGDKEKAESYYLRSKKIRSDIGDPVGVGTTLISIGNLWVKNMPLRAQPYYEEALQIFRQSDDKKYLGQALNNIANTYYYNGKYEESIPLMLEALEIQREIGNKREESLMLMNLGYNYMMLNQEAQAEKSFIASLNLARKIESKEQIAESLMGLGDHYEHFKKYQEANDYRNKYILYNDSLNKGESAEKVAELQIKFETKLKEQQIETLTRESELATLRLEKQQTTIAKQRSQLVFFVSFFFLFLLMIYGSYKRLKMRKQQELDAAIIREQQAGLKAVVKATEAERQRIAKDLHDGVAQTLSGVRLALDRFSQELNFEKDLEKQRFLQTIEYLDEAGNEVRSIAHQMMPAVLSKMGLIPALNDMLEKSLGHTKFNYNFEFFGMKESFRPNPDTEVNLFRICQELIQNVIKHSGADNVNIQLLKEPDELVLSIADDGMGFESDEVKRGLGLDNVRARVASLNGSLEIEKAGNTGVQITVRVPMESEMEEV